MHVKTCRISSAKGVLCTLDDPTLCVVGIPRLYQIVDQFWFQIADRIDTITAFEEDSGFVHRETAAVLLSKLYFYLQDYQSALNYALRSGNKFSQDKFDLYIEKIKSTAIDKYIEARQGGDDTLMAQLVQMLDTLFQHSLAERQFRHAVGIAMETRRMDWFSQAIQASDDRVSLIAYAYRMTMQYVVSREFRDVMLNKLVELYEKQEKPDYVNMCQCLIHLHRPSHLSTLLTTLVKDDSLRTEVFDNELMAYQLGFDLYESGTQDLLSQVQKELRESAPIPTLIPVIESRKPADETADEQQLDDDEEDAMEVESNLDEKEEEDCEEESKKTDEAAGGRTAEDLSKDEEIFQNRITKLIDILQGSAAILQHLQFLISNNKSDLLILKHTKEAVRASVCHQATVIANGFMHAGTTSDQFLRENLDWLSRATNWAKMVATASLGVVHRGHEKEALTLMQAYLPRESNSPGYVESGSLYALGLIHANHGGAIVDYLLGQTKEAASEVVRHGGCLGLGLAALGTRRMDIYQELHRILLLEDAVSGEGAGIAVGLVMMGSKQGRVVKEMLKVARSSPHEKIQRGVAMGLALTMYGQVDQAEPFIAKLLDDKNATLRRCAMYTLGLAYCGTGSTPTLRRLLHVAVSDVDNDVRRAAVEAIGFIMFRQPEQLPNMVSLLAESYNPYVRFGAAMALGIGCAGTGLKEALAMLETLTIDPVAYVRQGALLASALVLIQQTEATCPKVKEFRALYAKTILDKHEESITKFGAIIAQGIIDAGGRNVTITLQSRTGHTNMTSVIGMFVFTQFWFWYPLAHFLSLAFTPTCLIGLNKELQMPKIDFISNAKPSTYGYPAPMEEKKKEVAEKVTAVLSITAKLAKRKEEERKKREREDKMEVDQEEEKTDKKAKKEEKSSSKKKDKESSSSKKDEDSKKKDDKKDDEKKKPEPAFDTLNNPARVMKQQLKVVKMPESARYAAVKDVGIGGIIMMRDTRPAATEDLVQPVPAMGPTAEDQNEPSPPEDFVYESE